MLDDDLTFQHFSTKWHLSHIFNEIIYLSRNLCMFFMKFFTPPKSASDYRNALFVGYAAQLP